MEDMTSQRICACVIKILRVTVLRWDSGFPAKVLKGAAQLGVTLKY